MDTESALTRVGELTADLDDRGEELAAARRRIVQLETELAVTRCAAEMLKEQAPPFDGSRPSK